jgi:hypothetical protein
MHPHALRLGRPLDFPFDGRALTREEGSPQFSVMPSVNLRPAGASVVDIAIRYITITRAGVRVDARNRLFAMIVELMQGAAKMKLEISRHTPHIGA